MREEKGKRGGKGQEDIIWTPEKKTNPALALPLILLSIFPQLLKLLKRNC